MNLFRYQNQWEIARESRSISQLKLIKFIAFEWKRQFATLFSCQRFLSPASRKTMESHGCEKYLSLIFSIDRYGTTQLRYIVAIDWLVYSRFNPAAFVYASRLSKRHIQLVATTSKANYHTALKWLGGESGDGVRLMCKVKLFECNNFKPPLGFSCGYLSTRHQKQSSIYFYSTIFALLISEIACCRSLFKRLLSMYKFVMRPNVLIYVKFERELLCFGSFFLAKRWAERDWIELRDEKEFNCFWIIFHLMIINDSAMISLPGDADR